MKVFSVTGITESGKTTTIENIIKELRKRRYSVGSVKEIHYEKFTIDDEGTNTYRHKEAGSQLVTARGCYETDVLFGQKLSINQILRFYNHDYVILEGVMDCIAPKILTAHTTEEVDEMLNETVFAISGRLANKISEYKRIPVINAMEEVDILVDLIEEKVFEKLPDFWPECCGACGYSCLELAVRILQGKSNRNECTISNACIELYIDGKKVDMVPFVQNILKNTIEGVVKELRGYRPGAVIKIQIGDERCY